MITVCDLVSEGPERERWHEPGERILQRLPSLYDVGPSDSRARNLTDRRLGCCPMDSSWLKRRKGKGKGKKRALIRRIERI
jgi:hypothetical protein